MQKVTNTKSNDVVYHLNPPTCFPQRGLTHIIRLTLNEPPPTKLLEEVPKVLLNEHVLAGVAIEVQTNQIQIQRSDEI